MKKLSDGDQKVAEVFKTYDYSKFKRVVGNREVKVTKKLRNSIMEKGIINPITVTKEGYVIDGQHRLQVAEETGIPIEYKVMVNTSEGSDILQEVNISKQWGIRDYIHKYGEEGNTEYTKLIDVYTSVKGKPLTAIVSLGMGNRILTVASSGYKDIITEGKFKFYNYNEFLEYLKVYEGFLFNTDLDGDREMLVAFFYLYTIRDFSVKTLEKAIKERGLKVKLQGVKDINTIVGFLLENYNKSKPKNAISYNYDSNKKVYTREPLKDSLVNKMKTN